MTFTTIKSGESETVIKKSRFIATVHPATTDTLAQELIELVKKNHPKARHHCFAYILGDHQQIQRMSDDGEPSGTAGSPILNVLKQLKITNTLIVVTRYFGGIKLGTGGLIRAYGQAATTGIQAAGIYQSIYQQQLILTLSYADYDSLVYLFHQQQLDFETEFTELVTVRVWYDQEKLSLFEESLKTKFAQKIKIVLGDITTRYTLLSEN